MKSYKLNEDLSKLTSIPEKTLNKVLSKACVCIGDAVAESLLAGEDITEIILDFGSILIQCKENELKYKFVPNAKLEKELVGVLTEGTSTLEGTLEASLINKFTDLYRELC